MDKLITNIRTPRRIEPLPIVEILAGHLVNELERTRVNIMVIKSILAIEKRRKKVNKTLRFVESDLYNKQIKELATNWGKSESDIVNLK